MTWWSAKPASARTLVMKRFHARARGNAGGIEKFFSQITIVVEEKREEAPADEDAQSSGSKAAAPAGKSKGKAKAGAKKTSGKAPAKKPAARKAKSAAKKENRLMGQKVNPIGLRLGINRTWDSRWYAGKKEYGKLLQEDIKIREYLSDKLKAAGVSRIIIERPHKKCRVTIHSARPGVVIGKKGADIEKLKSDVQKYTTDEVHLNIVEIRKPEVDAKLVAENIAQQLERRVAFRRVMKRSVQTAMRLGALGIRITCSRPPRRRGNRPRGMVPRRPRAAAHPARRCRFRRRHRFHHLWHLRRQGLDLQGRDHGTRSLRHREAPGRSRRRRQPSAA